MRYLKGVGRFVANPLTVITILFVGLFFLSNLWRVIPGPYSILENRIAAFEVDKLAELLINVSWGAYALFVHRTDNLKWFVAKMVVALLLVLQIWDVVARAVCKTAANEIVAKTGEWIDTSEGLCAATVGPGSRTVQIIFGFLMIGYFICLYLRTRRAIKA